MTGIESAALPAGVLVVAALLYYIEGKRLGIGLSLVIVGAMFLLIKLGFELLSDVVREVGETAIAGQISSVGVYIGSLVGGACVLGGALIVALKLLLER